jgi:hypothetical protein
LTPPSARKQRIGGQHPQRPRVVECGQSGHGEAHADGVRGNHSYRRLGRPRGFVSVRSAIPRGQAAISIAQWTSPSPAMAWAMASAARPLPASITTGEHYDRRAPPRLAATSPYAICSPFSSTVTEDWLDRAVILGGGSTFNRRDGGQRSRTADTAVARRTTGARSTNATTCTMVTTAMSPGHEHLPPGQDGQV